MDAVTELTKKLATVEQLNLILADIAEAERYSYDSEAKDFSRSLKGKVSNAFEELVRKLEKERIIPASLEERSDYFAELKSQLQSLPKIEIELAFSPREEFINKISRFIRESTNSVQVLDIKVKPSILAGATFGYNGQYKDYSFSSRLADVLKQKYAGGLREDV